MKKTLLCIAAVCSMAFAAASQAAASQEQHLQFSTAVVDAPTASPLESKVQMAAVADLRGDEGSFLTVTTSGESSRGAPLVDLVKCEKTMVTSVYAHIDPGRPGAAHRI